MALTRDFKETVNARVQRDSEFAIALLDEAISREQVKAKEQINYLTKASIGYGIEKRVGKRQK